MTRHYSCWRLAILMLSILAGGTWSAEIVLGQYTWVQANAAIANWTDLPRWQVGIDPATDYPNGSGVTALISQPISTVTSGGLFTLAMPATDVTLGQFTLDNSNYIYQSRTTITNGGGRIIFEDPSGTAKFTETLNPNTAPANVQNQILTDIQLNSDLEITQNNYRNLNTGTRFFGLINGDSSRKIIKKGDGGIQIDYLSATLPAGKGFEGEILIQQGPIRVISSPAMLSKVSGITVSAGGQLQLAETTGVPLPDFSLATNASLKLNGNGTNATSTTTPLTPVGALNFGFVAQGRTSTFHNVVELQSDTTISVGALGIGSVGVLDNKVFGAFGLTKHGDGKLSITSPLSGWGGDTHILSALSGAFTSVLSVSNPILANSRDVYLSATRSALDLNFNDIDTIRSLYLDGVAQPNGVYGAIDSPDPTDIERPWITGSGQLQVTGLLGDFNSDGKVDAGDYVTWRKNEVANLQLAGDNGVGNQAARFSLWRSNFGNPSGSGTSLELAPVPEPATILLLALLIPFFAPLVARRNLGRTRS